MTLTELNYYIRRLAPFVVGIFIFFIILYFALSRYFNYLDSLKPRSLIIEPIFGKINKIALKKIFDYPENPKFILDTIEGRPKTATQTAKVFFLPPKTARFGYLQKIYLMAKRIGFDTDATRHQIVNQEAIFEDAEKKLVVDVANFNFSYNYDYQHNESIFEDVVLPTPDQMKEKIKSLLTDLGRYPEELAQGRENLLFLKYEPQTKEFTTVARKDDANGVEIDFFRPDIDGIPTVTAQYFTSHNFVVATFKEDRMIILKSQIRFFEKEDQKVGLYPLTSADEVWQELQNKKGLIVSTGRDMNQITIKKMLFSYLDSDVYQPYLQPVYVFLSADGFVGYVSAIKREYVE